MSVPVFGRQGPYIQPHHWVLSVGYQGAKSTSPNWRGTRRFHNPRHVINTQQTVDLSATYQATPQTFLQLRVPFQYGTWSVLSGPGYYRATQRSGGLGDVSIVANRWLLPVQRFQTGNIALGFGIKLPTGNWNVKDAYPDIFTGKNNVRKTVDQSIQLGDRELGIIGQYQAFKSFRYITFFSSASYLVSTRRTTGVPSLIAGLGIQDKKLLAAEGINSAPDQYLGTVGFVVPVPFTKGLALTADVRALGVPEKNLLSSFSGFRRPGFNLYAEPGANYTLGRHNVSVSVPIRAFTNMLEQPADGRQADATIPNWQILARYSVSL
jgi:hypothetical protein